MMITFLLLALALIGLAILLDLAVLRTRVIFTRHVLRTAGILVVTTLVFDNVLSALPVYVFHREKTLGIYLPWAPLEDLFYIVGVVFLVAVLDKFGRMRAAGRPGGSQHVQTEAPGPTSRFPTVRGRNSDGADTDG